MKQSRFLAFSLSVGGLIVASAMSLSTGCGTSGVSGFDAGDGPGSSGGSGGTSSSSGGDVIGSSSGTSGASGTSGTSGASSGVLNECANDSQTGDLKPLELLVIMDKSSSLCVSGGRLNCDAPNTIWGAATTALRSFLTDQASAGITLAVTDFGRVDGQNPNTVAKNRCKPEDYATPTYTPQNLPSAALADEVIAQRPAFDNPEDWNATMTQIGPAIRGATTYMTGRRDELAGAKEVAILLISDGEPTGCADDVENGCNGAYCATAGNQTLAVEAATAAAAAGFKLYVLNIGGNAAKLGAIAQAGGTELITVQDPRNANEIGQRLAEIRGDLLPCDIAVPTPEAGDPNYNQINLTLISSSGEELLYKTDSCETNPRGWQYDDPQNPSRILLCDGACNAVQSTPNGQLKVVLGCDTKTNGPN